MFLFAFRIPVLFLIFYASTLYIFDGYIFMITFLMWYVYVFYLTAVHYQPINPGVSVQLANEHSTTAIALVSKVFAFSKSVFPSEYMEKGGLQRGKYDSAISNCY